jgi:hypothetical protein
MSQKINNFRELIIWKLGMEIVNDIYGAKKTFLGRNYLG